MIFEYLLKELWSKIIWICVYIRHAHWQQKHILNSCFVWRQGDYIPCPTQLWRVLIAVTFSSLLSCAYYAKMKYLLYNKSEPPVRCKCDAKLNFSFLSFFFFFVSWKERISGKVNLCISDFLPFPPDNVWLTSLQALLLKKAEWSPQPHVVGP